MASIAATRLRIVGWIIRFLRIIRSDPMWGCREQLGRQQFHNVIFRCVGDFPGRSYGNSTPKVEASVELVGKKGRGLEPGPVGRLVVLVEVFFAFYWAVHWGADWIVPLMIGGHAIAAAVPFGAVWWARSGGRVARFIGQLYPVAFIGLHWTEAGIIHSTLHDGVYDAVVMQWDLSLFGVHLQEAWMQAMPYVWMSEAMLFLYFTYYPVVFGTPLLMAARQRHEATNDIVFRLFVTYSACFLIYLFFPVEGPKMSMGRMSGPHEAGFFYQLIEGLTEAGDSLGTAFPSSHVAGMTALAIAGYRWFRTRTNVLLTLLAVGMTASTVYVQHHFAIDALVGVVLAALCAVAAPGLSKMLMSRKISVGTDLSEG